MVYGEKDGKKKGSKDDNKKIRRTKMVLFKIERRRRDDVEENI